MSGSTDAPQAIPSGRPRLNLKPRDENAAKKAEEERIKKLQNNPFGDARPREQTLATRMGMSEEDVLKEAIKHERLRLRLTPQQAEDKQQLEALVEEVREQLKDEGDEKRQNALRTMLEEREAAVESLIDEFAHAALEAHQKGEVQRPSERRMLQQQQQQQQQQQHYVEDRGQATGGRGGRGGGYYNSGPDRRSGGFGSGFGKGRNSSLYDAGSEYSREGEGGMELYGSGGRYVPSSDGPSFGGGGRYNDEPGSRSYGGRGRGGRGGRGNWSSNFDDGYLPGMPPYADSDPSSMTEYQSPFPRDRF